MIRACFASLPHRKTGGDGDGEHPDDDAHHAAAAKSGPHHRHSASESAAPAGAAEHAKGVPHSASAAAGWEAAEGGGDDEQGRRSGRRNARHSTGEVAQASPVQKFAGDITAGLANTGAQARLLTALLVLAGAAVL